MTNMADISREVLDELLEIKRLLVFALQQQPGVTQTQIAAALGTSQSQISKMLGAVPGPEGSIANLDASAPPRVNVQLVSSESTGVRTPNVAPEFRLAP